jgi:hypothetical protein
MPAAPIAPSDIPQSDNAEAWSTGTASNSATTPNQGAVLMDSSVDAGADQANRASIGGTTGSPEPHPLLPTLPNKGGFAATLLTASVFFISLAVLVAVTLYILWPFRPSTDSADAIAPWGQIPGWWDNWKSIVAPIGGTLVAVVLACLFASVHSRRAQADQVDTEVYGELRTRLETTGALVHRLCPGSESATCEHGSKIACSASCDEARARWDFICRELSSHGSRWVLGTGYVDLYRQLHAIESALFLVQPSSEVLAAGLYDNLRLDGATELPNWKALQARLLSTLPLVGGPSVQSLTSPVGTEVATAETISSPPTPQEQALGRAVLRDIRQAISEFRDGERANLVRARNQLVWTGTITAIAGYVLMVLAMLRAVPPQIVSTGVVYYVVGATIGLFNQLRTESAPKGSTEEDFGFRRARLFYTPVLSGIAAVGGVLVVSLLYDAVDFGAAVDTDRSLGDIFNVEKFALGLVIAAVFGLVPDLLVDRLQNKADEYRAGLSSTTAAASGTTSTG